MYRMSGLLQISDIISVSGQWLPLVVCPIIVADLHNCHIHFKYDALQNKKQKQQEEAEKGG